MSKLRDAWEKVCAVHFISTVTPSVYRMELAITEAEAERDEATDAANHNAFLCAKAMDERDAALARVKVMDEALSRAASALDEASNDDGIVGSFWYMQEAIAARAARKEPT